MLSREFSAICILVPENELVAASGHSPEGS
jgi:hypothetical protein